MHQVGFSLHVPPKCQYLSTKLLHGVISQKTSVLTLIHTFPEIDYDQGSCHLINPLKPELNPICYLLALLGAHHFLHVSRIRVKLLTLR